MALQHYSIYLSLDNPVEIGIIYETTVNQSELDFLVVNKTCEGQHSFYAFGVTTGL